MIILGIDYGLHHTGLALLDTDTELADPLANVSTSRLFPFLKRLLHQQPVSCIVIGLPSGPLRSSVITLQKTLQQTFSLPIYLHPETLSTQEALTRLRALHAKRSKLKNEHKFSAALILEDFILVHSSDILDKS